MQQDHANTYGKSLNIGPCVCVVSSGEVEISCATLVAPYTHTHGPAVAFLLLSITSWDMVNYYTNERGLVIFLFLEIVFDESIMGECGSTILQKKHCRSSFVITRRRQRHVTVEGEHVYKHNGWSTVCVSLS